MTERDACKVTPVSIDAFNKGHEIGEQSRRDGNTGAALIALSNYTQSLFQADKSLPPGQRQQAWKDQSRDAMNGLACADPTHFRDSLSPLESDPRLKPAGPEHAKVSDVSSLVDGAYSALESGVDKDAGTAPPLDYRLALTNAFLHNRVEPLGEESRRAFAEDFNHRIAPKINSEDGLSLVAGLSEDGKRVQITRVPESPKN